MPSPTSATSSASRRSTRRARRAHGPSPSVGGVESTRGFGLIDAWEILRRTKGGRMILITVTLSDG
jgi:hypothetical protein